MVFWGIACCPTVDGQKVEIPWKSDHILSRIGGDPDLPDIQWRHGGSHVLTDFWRHSSKIWQGGAGFPDPIYPSLHLVEAGRLAKGLGMWHTDDMKATLSLDEAGRLVLPNTALRVLGIKPGDQVRADVSPNRIDICPEPPVMAQGVIENGVLVMARLGIRIDAAAAVRADRDSRTDRALPR